MLMKLTPGVRTRFTWFSWFGFKANGLVLSRVNFINNQAAPIIDVHAKSGESDKT